MIPWCCECCDRGDEEEVFRVRVIDRVRVRVRVGLLPEVKLDKRSEREHEVDLEVSRE